MSFFNKELVEMDVNLIDTVDDYGRTPLIICSSKKSESHIKIARLLLDFGCNIHLQLKKITLIN